MPLRTYLGQFYTACGLLTSRLVAPLPQVSVFDADRFSANDLIGYFQFDLSYVYFQSGHEVFRQVGN